MDHLGVPFFIHRTSSAPARLLNTKHNVPRGRRGCNEERVKVETEKGVTEAKQPAILTTPQLGVDFSDDNRYPLH